MKWILIFTVALATATPILIHPHTSFAQEDEGFEDFAEDFSEVEEGDSTDDSAQSESSSDTESVEKAANEVEENDDDFFAEEEELEDTFDKEEEVVENDITDELEAEEKSSEEVLIDEGNEDEFADFEEKENSGDKAEKPLEEPLVEDNADQEFLAESESEDAGEINDGNQQNAPDLQFEANLHDIFVKYHSNPMTDEQWDYIAGAKLSEVYTVQKGDTLWDLSKTFFGDGNYWPKIWSVNSNITNPHLIEPQNVIRFVLGSENEPPMFTVTEGKEGEGDEPPPAEEQNLEVSVEDAQLEDLAKEVGNLEKELTEDFSEAKLEEEFMSDEEIEGIVIPPPEKIIRPVTQVFPPSLPQWKSLADSVLESTKIEIVSKRPEPKAYEIALSYYIDENQPDGVGKVVGVEGGGTVAAQFQYIYVRARKGLLKEGDSFIVTDKKGPLRMENGIQEDAIIWEVQGKITIDQKLEATQKYRSKDFEVYRALVENSISAVSVGADLLRSEYTMVTLDKKGRIPAVSGLIIGGEFDTKRNLLAKESIAYMNVGTNEGVQAGDILPIYSNHYLEQTDPYVLTTKKPMGLIKVAKATELYSTGYVVENNGSINVGDFVGLKDGFEKEYLGKATYEKVEKSRKDKELEELKSLIEVEEDEVDPAETESYEYMTE